MNILVWAAWYPKDENSYNGIFIKKHLQIIGQKHNLQIFHITKHKLFSFRVKKNIADYGAEKIYFIPDFKFISFFAFLFIPIYEYLLVKSKTNVLHLHCSYPIILFAFTLKLFGLKKIVLTEHWSGYTTYDGAYDRMPFVLKFVLKNMLSSLSAISLVSNVLKYEMQKRNLLPEKTHIIPNVLNIPTILIDNKPKDYFSFITICTLEDKTKNITGIINAFKEAVLINNNIKLTIYGDGIDENKLKNYAQSLELLNRYIYFGGYIPNEKISEIYFHHHVFISFSNYETFSISSAEALTHGLPVIASKSGGPEEYINSKCGILVEPQNINQLTEAILYMVKNYKYFDEQEIQSYMRTKFSNQYILGSFEKLYND